MRYFLGFDLDAKTKLAIDAWRDKALPAFNPKVPAKNFHITVVFLGQVEQRKLEALCISLDKLELAPLRFQFNHLGYWSKPKVLFIGCTQTSNKVRDTHQCLTELCAQVDIDTSSNDYQPHITLVRKVATNPPAALVEPDFEVTISKLHLFESVSAKHGVQYPIRQSWDLNAFGRPGEYS